MIYNNVQKEIAHKIEKEPQVSNWKDWKWQIKHSIKSLEKFEYLTDIKFDKEERKNLEKHLKNSHFQLPPITYR